MAKIKVIFYKAKWGDKHWLDNAISLWTWLISAKNRKVGPYSHVEIWTPDTDLSNISCDRFKSLIAQGNPQFSGCTPPLKQDIAGTCWTSTMRGKDNGTVKRPASEVIENVKRWDVCEIEMVQSDYDRMLAWMEIEVEFNSGYSMRDLAKFFGLGFITDKGKNICSEFCSNAIKQAWGLDDDEVVSPRRLAYKLIQAGCTIKPMNGE